MALIKAAFKRTIRLREYENETIELGLETSHDEVNDGDAVKATAELFRALAEQGDVIVADRLMAIGRSPSVKIIETERDPADPSAFRPRAAGTPASDVQGPDDYLA